MKHIDVPYLWMQDEIGSNRFRMRTVKSQESAADLGTKPLSKNSQLRNAASLWDMLTWPKKVFSSKQDVAMSWGLGSIQIGAKARRKDPNVRDGRQNSQLAEFRDLRQTTSLELVTMTRKAHMRSAAAAATNTVAQLIAALKVSDRDKQRLH